MSKGTESNRTKGRTGRRGDVKVRDTKVRDGAGNVFADLRLPDAEGLRAKAELAHHVVSLISAAGLSQAQAAARLGVDQPKVSALVRGRLKEFSTERLMRFITAMDRDVVIAIRAPRGRARAAVRVVGAA